MRIADLYAICPETSVHGEKEYGNDPDIQVIGFDIASRTPAMAHINYVMRHRTTKMLYKTVLSNGNTVTVTEDHSLMVERNGAIIESKPTEVVSGDQFICLDASNMTVIYTELSTIECLGEVTDYVYDISIADQDHVFFANDCLVHNTDSCAADTNIMTNWGDLTIEALFNRGARFWNESTTHGIKEYAAHPSLEVVSYDPTTDSAYYGNINYIYRHKVSKERWEIEDADGNIIQVTGDHSVMIERDGMLMEVKPRDILITDVLLSL